MKRLLRIFMSVLLISSLSVNVLAAENTPEIDYSMAMSDSEIMEETSELDLPSLRTLYILGVLTTITEKDDGRILMGVQVYCTEIMQEITTVFYLQQEISGGWVNVASYTVTSEDVDHHVRAAYVINAPSGNYRVKTVNRVRDYNGFAESVTGFSPNMRYYNANL